MAAELRTVAAIARDLDLPESTVRYYRDRFADYIPSVGNGRGRRYPPEALAVLRFIADGLRSNVPASELEAALRARFPVAVGVGPQQQPAATQQQSAAVLRELLADALRDVLIEQSRALRNELAELRSQVAGLAATVEQREEAHRRGAEQLVSMLEEDRDAAVRRVVAVEAERDRLARERDNLVLQLQAARDAARASPEPPGATERARSGTGAHAPWWRFWERWER